MFNMLGSERLNTLKINAKWNCAKFQGNHYYIDCKKYPEIQPEYVNCNEK